MPPHQRSGLQTTLAGMAFAKLLEQRKQPLETPSDLPVEYWLGVRQTFARHLFPREAAILKQYYAEPHTK